MPWKIFSPIAQRARFVRAALRQLQPFTVLCRAFGISRRTGYKWTRRFRQDGRSGLSNRSRRPRSSPRRLPQRWRQIVQRLRRRRPYWGPRKFAPAVRTITQWLPGSVPRPGDIVTPAAVLAWTCHP